MAINPCAEKSLFCYTALYYENKSLWKKGKTQTGIVSPFASFWGNLVETSELFVITNSRLSARGLFAVPSDRRMEPPVPSQRLPLTVRCRAVSVQRPAQRCRAVRTWAPSAQLRESPAAAALD